MFGSSKKYDRLDSRFISLNARFDQIVNRLDRLDVDQRSTNDLAVSVNSAVDDVNAKVDENVCRIEERLAALEAASALHVELLDGPSAEATQRRLRSLEQSRVTTIEAHNAIARSVNALVETVDAEGARLSVLVTKHDNLNASHDHNARIVAKHLGLVVKSDDEPVSPTVQKRKSLAARAIAYAEAQIAAGLPVIEAGVTSYIPGGKERIKIRDAFESIGLIQTGTGVACDPYVWIRAVERKAA